jgi:hypothetical protein
MLHAKDGIRYIIQYTAEGKLSPDEIVEAMWSEKTQKMYSKMIKPDSTEDEKKKALEEAQKQIDKKKRKSVGSQITIGAPAKSS